MDKYMDKYLYFVKYKNTRGILLEIKSNLLDSIKEDIKDILRIEGLEIIETNVK